MTARTASLLAAVALAAAASSSLAQKPAASAAASAASSASAAPALAASMIGPDKTPRPGPADWRQARPVALHHASPKVRGRCQASVLREWLRLRCQGSTVSALTQLGGERDGVAFWIDPPSDKAAGVPGDAEILFPLRRGDRRVLQLWTFGPGYDGPLTVLPAFTLQEEWIDDSGPTILLL